MEQFIILLLGALAAILTLIFAFQNTAISNESRIATILSIVALVVASK